MSTPKPITPDKGKQTTLSGKEFREKVFYENMRVMGQLKPCWPVRKKEGHPKLVPRGRWSADAAKIIREYFELHLVRALVSLQKLLGSETNKPALKYKNVDAREVLLWVMRDANIACDTCVDSRPSTSIDELLVFYTTKKQPKRRTKVGSKQGHPGFNFFETAFKSMHHGSLFRKHFRQVTFKHGNKRRGKSVSNTLKKKPKLPVLESPSAEARQQDATVSKQQIAKILAANQALKKANMQLQNELASVKIRLEQQGLATTASAEKAAAEKAAAEKAAAEKAAADAAEKAAAEMAAAEKAAADKAAADKAAAEKAAADKAAADAAEKAAAEMAAAEKAAADKAAADAADKAAADKAAADAAAKAAAEMAAAEKAKKVAAKKAAAEKAKKAVIEKAAAEKALKSAAPSARPPSKKRQMEVRKERIRQMLAADKAKKEAQQRKAARGWAKIFQCLDPDLVMQGTYKKRNSPKLERDIAMLRFVSL
jgi:hypothetical protein